MDEKTNYQQALIDEITELPEEILPKLLQIVRLFKESMFLQNEQAVLDLQVEFAQRDQMRNEAMIEIEKSYPSM